MTPTPAIASVLHALLHWGPLPERALESLLPDLDYTVVTARLARTNTRWIAADAADAALRGPRRQAGRPPTVWRITRAGTDALHAVLSCPLRAPRRHPSSWGRNWPLNEEIVESLVRDAPAQWWSGALWDPGAWAHWVGAGIWPGAPRDQQAWAWFRDSGYVPVDHLQPPRPPWAGYRVIVVFASSARAAQWSARHPGGVATSQDAISPGWAPTTPCWTAGVALPRAALPAGPPPPVGPWPWCPVTARPATILVP